MIKAKLDWGKSKEFHLGFASMGAEHFRFPLHFQLYEVKQLRREPLTMWDANVAGSSLTHCATTLAPEWNFWSSVMASVLAIMNIRLGTAVTNGQQRVFHVGISCRCIEWREAYNLAVMGN